MEVNKDYKKPTLTEEQVKAVILKHYNFNVLVDKELNSFSAQNFLVSTEAGGTRQYYIVKIQHAGTDDGSGKDYGILTAHIAVMASLRQQGFQCQAVLRSTMGTPTVQVRMSTGHSAGIKVTD